MLFLPLNRSFPGNGMLSMKVFMGLTGGFFLAGSCQLEPGVIPAVTRTSHVPIAGHILGIFSMTNTSDWA